MTLPTAPSRTMDQDTFDSTTDAFIGALPQFETDMNALAAAMSLNDTTDTSATSNAIGTGAKTFTVSASKSFWPGMWLVIADTAAPTTNSMFCQVTSYSGTTLIVNSYAVLGSGTKTAWQISQSAPAALGSLYAALAGSASQTFSVATPSSAAHAVRADGVIGRNKIINGAMRIAQRGTSYALTTTQAYGSIDMWSFLMDTSAAGIANQDTASVPTGFQYCLKLGRNNGSALTNAIRAYYAAETTDSISLRSRTFVLSFYAKAGANFSAASNNLSVRAVEGTGTDEAANLLPGGTWTGYAEKVSTNQAITTSWVRYSFTGTFGNSMSQFGVGLFYTPTGTAGADDNVYITGIQLEIGSVASEFEHIEYSSEYRRCLWLCEKIALTGGQFASAFNDSTTQALGVLSLFPKRTSPTLSSGSAASDFTVRHKGATSTACSSVTLLYAGAGIITITGTVASGLTAGEGSSIRAANANAYILAECNL